MPEKVSSLDLIAKFKGDPILFFTKVLDVKEEHVWDKMREIALSVQNNQFTCVKAGNSLSKSYTMARIALWFLYTHYPSTVVTTAPSNFQVEEIIWREIRGAHSNAKVPLGGEPLKASLDLQTVYGGGKWFATGFATRPDTVTQQATRFQGFHNEHVLIIFDEAAGIEPEIWEAKDKLVTNPNVKFVAIGNPTVSSGNFVDCFKDKRYNKITVSVLDSPNYKQNRIVIPGLSGREFVEQTIEKYGEGSNQYKAMVTGEIPDDDIDSLISIAWIESAEKRKVLDTPYKYKKRFVVWDVADGGDDAHVIKAFENTTEIEEVVVRNKKIEEVEPYVWRLLRKIQGNCIVVDADGIGRVATSLLEQSVDRATKIIAFEGSSTDVNEPQTFLNRRHESHWRMREMFEKGQLCISSNPEQREELASVKLVDHRKGFIAIEPKKDLKQRLGRSPDHGDCIMMMCGTFDEIPIVSKEDSKYLVDLLDEKYCFNPMTV